MQHQHCRGVSSFSCQDDSFEAAYQSEWIPNSPIKFASFGKDGNGYSPDDKDGQGLNGMDHVLHSLIVMRKPRHSRY